MIERKGHSGHRRKFVGGVEGANVSLIYFLLKNSLFLAIEWKTGK
jgi:hypothetical protein